MAKLHSDLLRNTPIEPACRASMAVIDKLQDYSPEVQILGVGATLKVIAEIYKVNLGDILSIIDNIMHYSEGKRPEFAAVEEYVRKELKGI